MLSKAIERQPKEDKTLFYAMTVLLVLGMLFTASVGLMIVNRLNISPGQVYDEVLQVREHLKEIESVRNDADLVMRVLEDSGSAIVALDASGRITLWSKGAESLFGTSRTNAIGYGIAFLIPDDMRSDHRAKFDSRMRVKDGSFQNSVVCEAVHASGETIPVRINIWGAPGMAVAVFNKQDADTDETL